MLKVEGAENGLESPLTRGEWIEIYLRIHLAQERRSPLTRGEWIEIRLIYRILVNALVSPHPRGVDRNRTRYQARKKARYVSPHPRGVDRNYWIRAESGEKYVSPHPRGVDRNAQLRFFVLPRQVSPHPRGVDRNLKKNAAY